MLKIGDMVAFTNVPLSKRLPGDTLTTVVGELIEVRDDNVHVIEHMDPRWYVRKYYRQAWELAKVVT